MYVLRVTCYWCSVDGQTDQPRREDADNRVTTSEDRAVDVVPADVDVPVDGDDGDGEQRYDTADDCDRQTDGHGTIARYS